MAPNVALPPVAEVVYPDRDGKPISDNTKQARWITLIYENLEDACDSCKDFTHIVGNVVIKNA